MIMENRVKFFSLLVIKLILNLMREGQIAKALIKFALYEISHNWINNKFKHMNFLSLVKFHTAITVFWILHFATGLAKERDIDHQHVFAFATDQVKM
jgi:hypothetical protein